MIFQEQLRAKIKAKLNGYQIDFNKPNTSLKKQLEKPKRVAIVGGGLAGLSSAYLLTERGYNVHVFEKNEYLGGKIGAWTFESKGETLNASHGFHAFFRQYYNLNRLLAKIDATKYVLPMKDYLILYKDYTQHNLIKLDTTPVLNIISMRKLGIFKWREMIFNPVSFRYWPLLRYDQKKTFKQYDSLPASKFMSGALMPKKMRFQFNTFSRSFFANPEQMSTAEMIKSFHFYFLSNDKGLVYDVLSKDYSVSILNPIANFIKQKGGSITTGKGVDEIKYDDTKEQRFEIAGEAFDACILAADVKHVPTIISNSSDLKQFPTFYRQSTALKSSSRYAVWRVWTDMFEEDKYPFFIFTDRIKILDSITLFHRYEDESKEWSAKNNGGIFELHCYALPEEAQTDEEIKRMFLEELFHYLPELKEMEIKHEYYQHKDDFTAFHTNLHNERPTTITEVPSLYLAGDWVKTEHPGLLMEGACTTGILAVNEILKTDDLQEELILSVPLRGLLA